MPSRTATLKISATEFPHFRRLVMPLEAVEDYARLCADGDLMGIVDDCRDDLVALSGAANE